MDGGKPGDALNPEVSQRIDDLAAGLFRRGGDEFGRVISFSDGVFAFAMTLLVTTVFVPVVAPEDLGQALRDDLPDIVGYFVSFAVVGYYWLAHHRLVATLGAVNTRFIRLNMLYLMMIAFMPFPTALFGRYSSESVPLLLYATVLSIASVLEVALLVESRRNGLTEVAMAKEALRLNVLAALAPIPVFALSGVLSLFAGDWASLVWLLIIPLEWMVAKLSPLPSRLFT